MFRIVENKFWAEVDYIEDYERILNYRKNRDKDEKDGGDL